MHCKKGKGHSQQLGYAHTNILPTHITWAIQERNERMQQILQVVHYKYWKSCADREQHYVSHFYLFT